MNKLLIVDDLAQSRFFLFKLFESHGFKVFLAEDGMTAIEQFNRHRPEYVISDIHMPNMNGFALAWHLHHRHNQSVTLITSCDISLLAHDAADADGVASFAWPAAGRYWLEAEYKDGKAKPPATERSGVYVATFEVLPQ